VASGSIALKSRPSLHGTRRDRGPVWHPAPTLSVKAELGEIDAAMHAALLIHDAEVRCNVFDAQNVPTQDQFAEVRDGFDAQLSSERERPSGSGGITRDKAGSCDIVRMTNGIR